MSPADGYFGYNLERRPAHQGGGWLVRFIENGTEMGGGVFPAPPWRPGAQKAAYRAAVECGEEWFSRFQEARAASETDQPPLAPLP